MGLLGTSFCSSSTLEVVPSKLAKENLRARLSFWSFGRPDLGLGRLPIVPRTSPSFTFMEKGRGIVVVLRLQVEIRAESSRERKVNAARRRAQ